MCVPVPAQTPFIWSLFPRPLGLLATGCFLLALANTARGMGNVTCKVSPETVAAGQTVSVTFNFPYDVSQRRVVAVTVDRFPLKKSNPERVFECLKLDAPNFSCGTTSEGYSLEGEVKSSLTLRITDVSPEHSGRFFCYVMSPEKERPEAEPCSLVVRGSDRNGGKTTTSWMIPLIVTSVIFSLIIIFAVIFATILLCKRRKRGMETLGMNEVISADNVANAVKSPPAWTPLQYKTVAKDVTEPAAVTLM